jgi:hypothetical protein
MVGRTLMMLLRQVSQAHSSALTPAPTEMVGGVAYHKREEEIPGHVFGPTVGVQQTPCLVQRVMVGQNTFDKLRFACLYITFESAACGPVCSFTRCVRRGRLTFSRRQRPGSAVACGSRRPLTQPAVSFADWPPSSAATTADSSLGGLW